MVQKTRCARVSGYFAKPLFHDRYQKSTNVSRALNEIARQPENEIMPAFIVAPFVFFLAVFVMRTPLRSLSSLQTLPLLIQNVICRNFL